MIHSKSGNLITTIDISALEWFDRINGNSYYAGKVILNYGTDNQITLQIEYQYGYGEQYEYEALKAIKTALSIDTDITALWRFCDTHNIILRSSKQSAKKTEVKGIAKAFKAWELS